MTSHRKVLTYLEVDIDYCSLTYGQAPCDAQLSGIDGNALNHLFQNSATNGWAATAGTFTGADDAVTFLENGTDPGIRSGAISVDGSKNYIIRLDIERTVARSAGGWDGKVFYQTPAHGESASFYKQFSTKQMAQLDNVGTRQIIEFDMSELTLGDDDWVTSFITGLRLDFDGNTSNAGTFKIYSIRIGPPATATDATNANPNTVFFDGTNDYLTRGAGLTGAADGKRLTFSGWIKPEGGQLGGRLLSCMTSVGGGSAAFAGNIALSTVDNTLTIQFRNAAGTDVVLITTPPVPQDRWSHILISFDLASTSKRHVYVNGVSQTLTVTTYTNDTMDLTRADWAVGAWADGDRKFEGEMAEFWFHTTYIDLSVEANREMFRTTEGRPTYLGSNGSIPTGGTQPLIYLTNAAATFATNLGSGGNFTVTGTLAAGDQFSTGTEKCFNCRFSCQDILSFDDVGATLRFGQSSTYLPRDIDCDASIGNINFSPATVSLGENIGGRSSLTVELLDHPHPDTGEGFDKYYSERPYNPYEQGSIFGKLRARHPFLQGRDARFIRGLLDQSLSEMETRHLLVESFSGPGSRGIATLVAKDILKLADNDRAQAPTFSGGVLSADLTDVATTMTLSPTGIGQSYPESGRLNIAGTEIVAFQRLNTTDLLYHFDGTNGSTSAPNSNTDNASCDITGVNGGALSTAQFKFGTASLFLDGSNDYASCGANAKAIWEFGTGEFLFDFWIRPAAFGGGSATIIDCRDAVSSASLTLVMTSGGQVQVLVTNVVTLQGGTMTLDTWHHIMVSRVGNTLRIFTDGALSGTTPSATVTTNLQCDLTNGPFIGARFNLFAGTFANIYMDELRVVRGSGVSAAFTPPTSAYTLTRGDNCTITRAQLNTTAAAHSEGDRAQLVLSYEGEDPADIIYDLLLNYANVPASYMNLPDWQAETAAFFGALLTSHIPDPTAVNKLLDEIMELGFAVWWDDKTRTVKLQVLRQVPADAETLEGHMMGDSELKVTEQPEKRVSRVLRYFDKINPLTNDTDLSNYSSSEETIDTEAELDYGVRAVRTYTTRWIPNGGSAVAAICNQNILQRYRDPPRKFNFDLWREYNDTLDPALGGAYYLVAQCLQEFNGAQANVPIQLTRVNPMGDRWEVEAEEMNFSSTFNHDPTNRTIVYSTNLFNVNLRTTHDTLYADPESGDTVTCYINADVVIGSNSISLPAFDVGDWPSGVTIEIVVLGTIQGHGGNGAGIVGFSFVAGQNGGTALYARYAVTISGTGNIWGGGGGGGVWETAGPSYYAGGGGAGTMPGIGGTIPGSNSGADGTSTAGGAGGFGIGGTGGNPGQNGTAGNVVAAPRGLAGNSIDGDSYVSGTGPDIQGPQVN